MCGIFGASLNPKVMDRAMTKAAIAKFKILGIFNVDRGKHSCGVYVGDSINKGVDSVKLFYDYIAANHFADPMESGNFTMIGHTRMATNGTHTLQNAHPFLIDDEFVLAHNGVIRNVWQLCNKNGINHSEIHVDSLGLAHLIHKKGFSILDQYEGFAALLMANRSEPNSIYVYHGASKNFTNGEPVEERPLFYIKCEEGIYFSSIEKSLLAISDSINDKIEILPHNIVFKITNGTFTKVRHSVDRGNNNVGVSTNTHGGSPAANYPKPTGLEGANKLIGNGTSTGMGNIPSSTNSRVGSTSSNPRTVFQKSSIPMIWFETLPSRVNYYTTCKKAGIIYNEGRYWIIGTDGVIEIAHGAYYINKKGFVNKHKEGRDFHNFFFYEGVMMKSFAAYTEACEDNLLKSPFYNKAMMLSKYADYPVCNSKTDIKENCRNVSDYIKYCWFQNETMCTNTGFTPRFSDRNYIIREGVISGIKPQPNKLTNTKEEETINHEKWAEAKGEKKEDIVKGPVIVPPAPAVADMGGSVHELPFPEPSVKDKSSEKSGGEYDVQNFYKPYQSAIEARKALSLVEINALRYYIADIMMGEMSYIPVSIFDENVDVQLNMFLSVCAETNTSIIDNWDDKNYKDVLEYIVIAEDNPDGYVFDTDGPSVSTSKEDEAPVEVCEYVPKPPIYVVPPTCVEDAVEKILAQVKPISEEIKRDNLRIVVNNIQDAMDGKNLDEEPPVIDIIMEKETGTIPEKDDESRIYSREEERDFTFMDIIDSFKTIRDCADELTREHPDDDFAQESANIIYRGVDPLLRDLRTVTEKFSEVDLTRHINLTYGKRADHGAVQR